MANANRMMLTCLLLVVVVSISGFHVKMTTPLRILSVIPFPMKSHDIVFKPLLLELAKRGHQVTAITTFPTNKNVTNYKEILFETKGKDLIKKFDFYEAKVGTTVWNVGWSELFPFWDLVGVVVEDIFSSPQVVRLIDGHSEVESKFDAVICEGFFGSEAVLALGELYKAPTIVVATFGSTVYMNQYVGNPIATSYYPNFLLPYTDLMSFPQRLHNFLLNSFVVMANQLFHVPHQEKLIEKYLGQAFGTRPIPRLNEVAAQVSLILLNTHSVLGYSRPNLPNIIDVGGLHIQQPTNSTLDKNLQREMDSATGGIIYFSLGSNVNIRDMPGNYKQAFLNAFSKLPQKVFWKSDYEIPDVMVNVVVRKWFPQQQILAHRNCMAFITHGGLLSLEEAAYYAVPVVGIPFFGDQMMNMKLVQERNFGIELEYENITEISISWAIHQIIHNTMYKENARKLSSIFRDNYGTPLDRAVYWTEYVVRHDGAKHLRSAARLLPWYKLHMLDVLLAITAVILVPIVVLLTCCLKQTTRTIVEKSTKTD